MMLEGRLFLSSTSSFSKPGASEKKQGELPVNPQRKHFVAALWSVYRRSPAGRDVLRQTLPSWHLRAGSQPMKETRISI